MACRTESDAHESALDDPRDVVLLRDLSNAGHELVHLPIASVGGRLRQHVERGGEKRANPLSITSCRAASKAEECARPDRLGHDAVDHFRGDMLEQPGKGDPAFGRDLLFHFLLKDLRAPFTSPSHFVLTLAPDERGQINERCGRSERDG